MASSMRAVVLSAPGPVENLQIRQLPLPEPEPGWVRVKVEAFGLNRSELHTRLGLAEGVIFPRVLGIECVGAVDAIPGGDLQLGQQVAAMMGGMGRTFDGGYAEYTVVPRTSVIPFHSDLPWEVLGAIPETLQTAYGSLTTGLDLKAGETLLVRGGTSALGLVAAAIAKDIGATVLDTTRRAARARAISDHGADLPAEVLQRYLDKVASGQIALGPTIVYRFDDIRKAHTDMEHNRAVGKLVVRIDPSNGL